MWKVLSTRNTITTLFVITCCVIASIAIADTPPMSQPAEGSSYAVSANTITDAFDAGDYVCGDANGDGEVNVADAVFTINFVFKAGPGPDPIEAGDANGDGACNVGDAVYTVNFVFRGGPPIVCEPLLVVGQNTGCKSFSAGAETDTIPENFECVEWTYDGSSMFYINHINTIFNCCPDVLLAYMTITGDEIVIREDEDTSINGGCDCICLFNFDYHIDRLPPGHYTFTIIGKYLGSWEPITFEVDLTGTPSSGMECVERPFWPQMNSF